MISQDCLFLAASEYEIRCYTNRDALTSTASFEETGILVHSSFTPTPLNYGQRQTTTVGVPWPNEVFYYAIVSIDAAGNRSPISNIISVYISEAESSATEAKTEAPSSDSTGPLYDGADITSSPALYSPSRERSRQIKMYIAIGVVSGLILIVLVLVAVILIRVRTRRSSAAKHQYDADRRDSYKAYEPTGAPPPAASDDKDANGKSLSSWLDSLPRSEVTDAMDGGGNTGTMTKQHTLTKTNPYRHKVLTNGSFLNLKDLPAASSSSDDSSRPTTSTEDSSEGGGRCDDDLDEDPSRSSRVRRTKSTTGGGGGPNVGVAIPTVSEVMDTSTARAIIDTYSGNLFSPTGNNGTYVSYYDIQSPGNHGAGFGNHEYGFPARQHPHQQQQQQQQEYSPQRQSFRLRTESVV